MLEQIQKMVSWILISFDINNTATDKQILNKWFLVKGEVTVDMISYFRQIFNEIVVQLPALQESRVSQSSVHTATKQPHLTPYKFKDCKNSEKQTVP
jgi:hypothetical protein